MKLYDYNCEHCGNTELDILVKETDEVVLCKLCNEPMTRLFPTLTVKTPPRHHHSLEGYKPGPADVHFGKVKDGWY